jgi:hypothetical protein
MEHSYVKAGHHITANALGHTFMKVAKAVSAEDDNSLNFTPDKLGAVLGSGIYPGGKFADERLVMIHFRKMFMDGKLSFALARRLSPLGPGTITPFLLSRVLSALDEAKFFSLTGRAAEYKKFKAAYAIYEDTAMFETPYANWMYGKSRTESTGFKNFMATFLHYAYALDEIMAGSSYTLSVSLKRDAKAAASNSLVANLEVKSFVVAYKRYIGTLVTTGLREEAKKALGGAAGFITDG